MMNLPSWRYHRELPPRLVHTPADVEVLGPEWVDSPAAFETPAEGSAADLADAPLGRARRGRPPNVKPDATDPSE